VIDPESGETFDITFAGGGEALEAAGPRSENTAGKSISNRSTDSPEPLDVIRAEGNSGLVGLWSRLVALPPESELWPPEAGLRGSITAGKSDNSPVLPTSEPPVFALVTTAGSSASVTPMAGPLFVAGAAVLGRGPPLAAFGSVLADGDNDGKLIRDAFFAATAAKVPVAVGVFEPFIAGSSAAVSWVFLESGPGGDDTGNS
jgi:hypothetical protein